MTTVKVASPAGLLDALATADDIEVAGLDEVNVTAAHGQHIVSPMRNEEEGEKR
jgi:hypothetical protein